MQIGNEFLTLPNKERLRPKTTEAAMIVVFPEPPAATLQAPPRRDVAIHRQGPSGDRCVSRAAFELLMIV